MAGFPLANVEDNELASAEWHWEQGTKYAVEGIKTALLLNGAAAISLMTFATQKTFLGIQSLLLGCLRWEQWFLLAPSSPLTQLSLGMGMRRRLQGSCPWLAIS